MNLTQLVNTLRGWIKYSDPDAVSDELITSWVRWGEERINMDLRVGEQIDIDVANVVNARILPPNDWIKNDFMRFVDGTPLRFLGRDDFYSRSNRETTNYYTTSGRFLIIGGEPDTVNGRNVELHYFARVPPLGNTANWLSSEHPSLLTSAALIPAHLFLEAPEMAATMEAGVSSAIIKLNDDYRSSIASGSILKMPKHRGYK